MKSVCKFCKRPYRTFGDLKEHQMLDHPHEYARVEAWLHDTDYAIIVAECQIKSAEREGGTNE